MKILLIADTEEKALWEGWTDQTKETLSDIELVLSAGDLHPGYLEFIVTMLNVPLVYVRGNHDGMYDETPPEGCTDADGRVIDVCGLRILGLGGSMRYKDNSADMYTEEEMRRRIYRLRGTVLKDVLSGRLRGRNGIDILLTHAPCRGYGDMEDLPHTGFECFNELLERQQPKIHCYGHVHKEYGNFRRVIMHPSGTALINASGSHIIEI